MGKFKRIAMLFLVIALAVNLFVFGFYMFRQKRTGGTSPMYHISEEGRAFIVDTFGKYNTMEDLIRAIEIYEWKNFTYDKGYRMGIVQGFQFDAFLEKETGVCWELAAFAKCVIGEISKLKGWDIANYIVDIRYKEDFFKTHSYNYVITDDGIYVFDLTTAVTKGKSILHRIEGDSLDDIYAYSRSLDERPYRVQ